MPDRNEELVYEEKIDRIAELLEELILDAMLAALGKIQQRNDLFRRLAQEPPKIRPVF
jgi:hypothetical protein